MATRARFTPVVGLALLLGLAGSAAADSFVAKDFDQLVAEAEEIFVGTLVSSSSSRLATGAVVSDLLFADVEVVKGPPSSQPRTIRVLGGTIGDLSLKVGGIPDFVNGRRYVLFSKGNGRAVFPFVGGTRGVFRVARDAASGADLVFDASGNPVSGLPPAAAPGGRASVADGAGPAPVRLDVFLHAVRDRLPR